MSKHKFRLTKENKEQISIAIKDLKEEYYENHHKRAKIKGRKMIESGTTHIKVGAELVEVDPKKFYLKVETIKIDHQKEAENECRLGGVPALQAYVVKVLDRQKQKA